MFYSFSTKYFPQSAIKEKIGISSFPFAVKPYSTLGGVSAKDSRYTKPSLTNSFNWVVNTFLEIPSIMASNCPNLFSDLFKL